MQSLLFALVCALSLSRATVNKTLTFSWRPTTLNHYSVSYWVCENAGCSVTPTFQITKTCPGFYCMYAEVLDLDFSSRFETYEYFQVKVGNEEETCRDMGRTCYYTRHEYVDCGNGFNITSNVLNQNTSTANVNVTLKIGTGVKCGNPPGTTVATKMGARVILYCHSSSKTIPVRPRIPTVIYSRYYPGRPYSYDYTWDLSTQSNRTFQIQSPYYTWYTTYRSFYFSNRCPPGNGTIYANLDIDLSTAGNRFPLNNPSEYFSMTIRPYLYYSYFYSYRYYSRSHNIFAPTITVTCDSLGTYSTGKPKWARCFSNLNMTEYEPKYQRSYQSMDVRFSFGRSYSRFNPRMNWSITFECSSETKKFNRTTSTGKPYFYTKTYPTLASLAKTAPRHRGYQIGIGLTCGFLAVVMLVWMRGIYMKIKTPEAPSGAQWVPDEEDVDDVVVGQTQMAGSPVYPSLQGVR